MRMKHTFYIFILLAVALVPAEPEAGTIQKTLSFQPPKVNNCSNGKMVAIPGCLNVGHPGHPLLPVYPARFILPPGEAVASIKLEKLEVIKIKMKGKPVPATAQIPLNVPDGLEKSQPTHSGYTSQSYPPPEEKQFLEQKLGPAGVVFIPVHPCSYKPESGLIEFSPRIRVIINTKPRTTPSASPYYRNTGGTIWKLKGTVENPETIREYQSNYRDRPFLNSGTEYVPYLVITDSTLAGEFVPLVSLNRKRGLKTEITTTSWIENNIPGIDIQDKIRNFIINSVQNRRTEYVLLGGDDEIIPHRAMYCKVGSEIETDIPSDLYYACLDGNWNEDGDSYFGEEGEEDLLPEVVVGRLPVDSPAELGNFLTKLESYFESPPPSQATRALMVGELLWDMEGEYTWGADYKDEIKLGSSNYGIESAGLPANFNTTTLYDRDLTDPWSKWDLITCLNSGVNLINHLGHCSIYTMMRLTPSDLSQIDNSGSGVINFVVYSQGCYAASFDNRDASGQYHSDDCIGEQLVTRPNGAVALVGNTRLGWDAPGSTCGVSQFFDRMFFHAIFGQGKTTIGEALNYSVTENIPYISYPAFRYVMYEMCLLGDPAMQIWTREPSVMNVQNDSIICQGQDGFMVRVFSEGAPLEGARVSLHNISSDFYVAGFTDCAGETILQPDSFPSGMLELNVNMSNHYHYTDTISVVEYTSALVTFAYFSPQTDTLQPEYGASDKEILDLNLALKNEGTSASTGCSVILSCQDPLVSVRDSLAQIGTLPPGNCIIKEPAFTIEIDQETPDSHRIPLKMKILSSESEWVKYQEMQILAPRLEFISWSPSDHLHGNGNGCLESWEFHCLNGRLYNAGNVELINPRLNLYSSDNSIVVIPHGTCIIPSLQPGDTLEINGRMEFFIREFTPPFTPVELLLRIDSDNYPSIAKSFNLITCGNSFASPVDSAGIMHHHPMGGLDQWHISSQDYSSPPSSWKCGSGSGEEYFNVVDAVMILPPMCLYDNSTLTFSHRMEAEAENYYPYWAYDAGVVEISTDHGKTWEKISPLGSYPCRASSSNTIFLEAYEKCYSGNIEWTQETFDLSEYSGPVQLRFHFTSDEQFGFEGWYIDDIHVSTDVPTGDPDIPPVPLSNSLDPAYPNPFNPSTLIPFQVAERSFVRIEIYDVAGRRIRSLAGRIFPPGKYQVTWRGRDSSGRNVSSGVYFCRMTTGPYQASQRMVLVR